MQQITPNLYIGDVEDAKMQASASDINTIIYLGQEIPTKLCFNCSPICIHIPLNDGINDLSKIRKALFLIYITSLVSYLGEKGKLLISCRAGISRSVLFTTAIYSLTQKISFDEAYVHIKQIRPQSQPELNLLKEVKQITEELKCCT